MYSNIKGSENDCDIEKSYVQIFKYTQSDYSYVAYLECPNYNSKENLNEITPKIEAVIDENPEERTAHARIKITGNDKIVSYSYILYRNNKQIKNTGNIPEKGLPATKNINFSLEDFTPGNIKLVVTATNTYGNTKTVTKNIPDQKVPICVRNKKGTFNVSGFSATFSDDHSGFDDYYYNGKEIFDKNGISTEGAGCLSSKGHNPCTYRWSYTYYDDAYNTAEYTIDYKVGYIGKNDVYQLGFTSAIILFFIEIKFQKVV